MAIPRKKSRKIIVSNTEFRWSSYAAFGRTGYEVPISVAIELYEAPTSLAHFLIDGVAVWGPLGPSATMPISPKVVKQLIEIALKKGWEPHSKKNFLYRFKGRYDENNVFHLEDVSSDGETRHGKLEQRDWNWDWAT